MPIPTIGVVVRRSGPYPAVYKVTRSYRNEKGQPTNDRVNIGKLDLETGKLIPNAKYWEYYGPSLVELEILPTYNSIRSFGTEFLVEHIMSSLGINETLDACLEDSSLVKTAALYMTARGNVFEGVLDYCEDFTLFRKSLASSSASELFASITYDQRMAFFKKWVDKQQSGKYLAYDVTSFSTYSKDIIDSEWRDNSDGEKLPQNNLGCFLSEATGMPVFYVTYPGSIVDKSHLQYMMAYNPELGIKNVGFVLDRGFCSTANIKFLAKNHYEFIMGVPTRCKTTLETIDLARDSIISKRNLVADGVYAVSKKGFFYGTASVMNVYYCPDLAEHKRKTLFRSIESQEESLKQLKGVSDRDIKKYRTYFSIQVNEDRSLIFKRNFNKIDNESQNFGFFCLLTNIDLNALEILDKYRRKDAIENIFDDIKNHIDMKRMRTHNSKTTDGKLFCCFIALIIVSEIGIKLKDLMKIHCLSKNSIIREMEKIRLVIGSDGKKVMNPLTQLQCKILEPFGLGEEDVKAYLARLT
ncbi:MAG: transposase [Deltaproteobacteria bacterium]|nr:transposase [Deltaproteobacteria bacterium]